MRAGSPQAGTHRRSRFSNVFWPVLRWMGQKTLIRPSPRGMALATRASGSEASPTVTPAGATVHPSLLLLQNPSRRSGISMRRRSIGTKAALQSAPRPNRTWLLAVLAAALLSLVVAGVATAQGDHASHGSTTFAAHDYSFEGPTELSAGWQYITLTNEGAE